MEVKPKNNSIFKAYDIRGIYPSEVSNQVAFKIGQAFSVYIKRYYSRREKMIVVGHDSRFSSPSLSRYLIKGLKEQGSNVIDIGLSTTPMFYYACVFFKANGGIMVTASHNPKQYNGFKLVRERAIPLSGDSGLGEIEKIVTRNNFPKVHQGDLKRKKILFRYVNFITRFFDFKKIKRFKVVVDTGNSVPGIVIPGVIKKTRIHIFNLFKKLDGNFPNHQPNPSLPKNLRYLCSAVKSKKADLGLAFDGDGDRVVFVDEKGKPIRPDLITALISIHLLKNHPGEKILFDVRSSNIVRESIKKNNGIPVMSRAGHSFIKEKMKKDNILFGGELSGHYYLRDNYFFESPFFVFFTILTILTESGESLSKIIKPLNKYYHSPEINFKLLHRNLILKKIENRYAHQKGKICKIDGLRVDFPEWWFNLRLSHTEPVLRLVVEAKTRELMEKKVKELTNLIKRG